MTRLSFLAPLCGLALLVSGCGSEKPYDDNEKPRIPVSGKVTLDGQPIDGGTISFLPKTPGNRPTGGPIVAGEYSVPEEKGGNEGPYLVQISWQRPTGKKVKDSDTGEMIDETKEAIPQKYNQGSTIQVQLSDVNNTHDFDLKSK